MFAPSTYNVTLHDGRTVDICTEEGANAFLRDENSNCDLLISSTLKKKLINPNHEDVLNESWAFLSSLSLCTLIPISFGRRIPEAEIQFWLEHVIDDLKKQST